MGNRYPWIKTHSANGLFAGVPSLPVALSGKAIYIVRDPRAVACSYAHHLQIPIDDMIQKMNDPNLMTNNQNIFVPLGSWSKHVQSWTEPGMNTMPTCLVKYEEMLDDPMKEFKDVVDFMLEGEPAFTFTPKYDEIRKAVRAAKFSNLQHLEKKHGFRENRTPNKPFFREGKAQGFVEELTYDQQMTIIGHHHEVMEKLGYSTTAVEKGIA